MAGGIGSKHAHDAFALLTTAEEVENATTLRVPPRWSTSNADIFRQPPWAQQPL